MEFSENDKNVISVPKYENCFVYFLLQQKEVVYVGKTTHGITRPFSHHDKEFDEIKIIYCNADKLDIVEDSFIQKYKPIYNKQNNYAVRWGLVRVRNCIRKQTGQSNYTIPALRKVMKTLNICPLKDYYNGKETISFDEYKLILNYLERSEF